MSIFNLSNKDIGIDLGTANILITIKEKGIVLSEPSVIAINIKTNEVLETGYSAKEMIGKTPKTIKVIRPVKNGVIADLTATILLLKITMKKVCKRYGIKNPRVVVGIPSQTTEVEERALEEAILLSGAKEVFLLEETMAAAIGTNLEIEEPTGSIIVDIGAGKTEVSVISLGGIVVSDAIKIAGDEMDEKIIEYIKKKYNVLIGENLAEKIKINIGCAKKIEIEKSMEVKGLDLKTGLPKQIIITSNDIEDAIKDIIQEIIDIVKIVLEKTPPEISSDIVKKGIYISGGVALLEGLDEVISEKTKTPVYKTEDSVNGVIKGIGKVLEDVNNLKTVLTNSKRRR